MDKSIDISVIVPIYKVEKFIERSLTTLFEQSKSDGVEFLLINDATPDRSMEIARQVAARYPGLDILSS
ncbi:MAG: glycosyltransferase [Rikenellaceae bacterium]